MRPLALLVTLLLTLVAVPACTGSGDGPARLAGEVVPAACGECRLGLDGDDCTLAVRVDGRVLRVVGTGIDDHGDAHAADGLCNAVRRARVTGTVDGDRFVAEAFELLP